MMAAADLLPEQESLLIEMVEASRRTLGSKRHPFLLADTFGGTDLVHQGFPGGELAIYLGDFEVLKRSGLVLRSGVDSYDVSPPGFRHYADLKQRSGERVLQMTGDVRSYLDSNDFRNRHPGAFAAWIRAEALLWGDDSAGQLTAIGHHCRDAVQIFATELVAQFNPPDADPDPQHEIKRVKAVLVCRANQLGKTERLFLDALLGYWQALSQLIQRQEHGAMREKELVSWEDARRLVYQTANAMFEIDQSLKRLS